MNRIGNIDLSGYVVAVLVCFMMGWPMSSAVGQEQGQYDYRILGAGGEIPKRQKEMNALAADGFRFAYIAGGPHGLFVVMQKNRGGGMQSPRYQYKMLMARTAPTMRKKLLKELASEAGFSLVGMVVAWGPVIVLERRAD